MNKLPLMTVRTRARLWMRIRDGSGHGNCQHRMACADQSTGAALRSRTHARPPGTDRRPPICRMCSDSMRIAMGAICRRSLRCRCPRGRPVPYLRTESLHRLCVSASSVRRDLDGNWQSERLQRTIQLVEPLLDRVVSRGDAIAQRAVMDTKRRRLFQVDQLASSLCSAA